MITKTNEFSVCSIISLAIVDFAEKGSIEKFTIKDQLNALISNSIVDIAPKDRMLIDTNNGATIICNGTQENVLEDALFIAITIRDEVLKKRSTLPQVVLGIHTASIGKHDNVEGGVAEAQAVMQLADPNQILISNEYYKAASQLTKEISEMFEPCLGGNSRNLYAVRLLNDKVERVATEVNNTTGISELETQSLTHKVFDWTYIIPVLLSFALFFVLYELVLMPSGSGNITEETVVEDATLTEDDDNQLLEEPVVVKPVGSNTKAPDGAKKQ